jgi:hypothetical protein
MRRDQHAREPWSVQHVAGTYALIDAGGEEVARFSVRPDSRANAALCSHAPTLLAEARWAFLAVQDVLRHADLRPEHRSALVATARSLLDAIALATETPCPYVDPVAAAGYVAAFAPSRASRSTLR